MVRRMYGGSVRVDRTDDSLIAQVRVERRAIAVRSTIAMLENEGFLYDTDDRRMLVDMLVDQ